jgi:hypothetical protein
MQCCSAGTGVGWGGADSDKMCIWTDAQQQGRRRCRRNSACPDECPSMFANVPVVLHHMSLCVNDDVAGLILHGCNPTDKADERQYRPTLDCPML